MTRSHTWTTAPEQARAIAEDRGAHPHYFGEGHHNKPVKALVGIGALVMLSFLLYEFDGKSSERAAVPSAQHQNIAATH